MHPNPHDPRGFCDADVAALAAQLQALGFRPRATIEPGEAWRLGRGDALVVCRATGVVSARGTSWDVAYQVLFALCADA